MATDGAGLQDGVQVELNPEEAEAVPGPNHVDLPKRPADSANRGDWVDYVVALGGDRSFLENDTEHHEGEPDSEQSVSLGPATKAELQDLANQLGG